MMNHIKYGVNCAIRQKKALLLIYILQLLIAIPIGMQVFQVIEASIGNSLSMDIIQEGFNRTVFEDFLNIHGASISPLIGTLRYILPTYLILSIFLHAGIIGNIINEKLTIISFFNHGLKYFMPFLWINLVMLVVLFLWSLMVWIPYATIIGNPVEDLSSEKVFVISLLLVAIIYFIGFIMIWLWILNSKFSMVLEGNNIYQSLRKGLVLMLKKGFSQLGIFTSFAIIHGITILLYFLITNPIGASSMLLILFVMTLQQFFVIFRVGLRIALYGSMLSKVRSPLNV